jgi:hypothetical protein
MPESRKSRWAWPLTAVLLAVASAVLVLSVDRQEVTSGPPEPGETHALAAPSAEVKPPMPDRTGSPATLPSTGPVTQPPGSLAERAERARTARSAQPRDAVAQRLRAQGSPCDQLHGEWRLDDGDRFTLSAAGSATWREHGAHEAHPVRWLCMQDGSAELVLDDARWRLARDERGEVLTATVPGGVNRAARRVNP